MKPVREGITVFIPVYNEAALLVPHTERLITFLDNLMTNYEIIIGSNGSTDRTGELAEGLCRRYGQVHFFHLNRKGVGAAFREGVRRSTYDRIITVDMDLSINLDFVRQANRLLTEWDMIIGSKMTGSQQRSWIRTAASTLFISIARFLLQIEFHDYSIAAKGYRKALVERYLRYIDDKTFYVFQIAYRAHRDGRRLREIPVQCEDMRESRFNLIHEGVYKFGNLFLLWLSSIRERSSGRAADRE